MKRVHTGFTLVELMIALAVGTIILTIGIPAFTEMMTSNRTTATANDFIGTLRLARSEAIKRGLSVTVCPNNGNYSACGAAWGNGWFVFADPDGNGAYTAGTDTLIRTWREPEGDASFNADAPPSIRFLASGGLSGTVDDFAFQMSDCSGERARTISISKVGRAEATHSACVEEP